VTDRPLGCGGFSWWAVAGSVTVPIITTSRPMLTKRSFPRNGFTTAGAISMVVLAILTRAVRRPAQTSAFGLGPICC
jgi:hypothetical protein